MAISCLFKVEELTHHRLTAGDGVPIGVAVLLYVGARLALHAPAVAKGMEIFLVRRALPWYALPSVGGMAVAFALSMLFTLVYGRMTAYHRRTEQVMIPLPDVLRGVPILSFLPMALLGFSDFLTVSVAAELASVVLIFTSQAWNLTFAYTPGRLLGVIDPAFALVGMLGLLLAIPALIGNMARVERRRIFVEADALLIMLVYLGGMYFLCSRGIG
jgi:hypothetical protein